MPLQNRVTPLGDLVAEPGRGLVYGNRGCLHDASGRIRRHHNGKRWIACRLEFRGWHRAPLLQPGRFTELFFLDEATALAAGHRPCALCRRADYEELVAIQHGGAEAIDARLHAERFDASTRTQRRHEAAFRDLPDGTFVVVDGAPFLVLGSQLLLWSAAGYRDRRARPMRGRALQITPPSLVQLLRAGRDPVVPFVHPTALA
jgi:hypothetical protein